MFSAVMEASSGIVQQNTECVMCDFGNCEVCHARSAILITPTVGLLYGNVYFITTKKRPFHPFGVSKKTIALSLLGWDQYMESLPWFLKIAWVWIACSLLSHHMIL
jgi:hypothetical protein